VPRYEKIRDELAAMKPYLETEYHVRELGLFETTCKTQYLTKLGTDTATAPQTNVSRSSLVEEVRLVECD
jgi:hypothetical protein